MSVPATAYRLTIGPSHAGGDYDLLAASDGLEIRGAARESMLNLHFSVMQLDLPRVAHGLVRLDRKSDAPWLLFSAGRVGAGTRGELWVTEAAVIPDDAFHALEGNVHALFAHLTPGTAPTKGTRLPGLSLSKAASPAPNQAGAAIAALAQEVRVGVETRADAVDALLFAALDALPAITRGNLTFFSGPPAIATPVLNPSGPPDLSVWGAGEMRRKVEGVTVIAARDPNQPVVPKELTSGLTWASLVAAAAAREATLARSLEPLARQFPVVGGALGDVLQQRLQSYMDGLASASPDARRAAFEAILIAASAIANDQARLEIGKALLEIFRGETQRSKTPGDWLALFTRRSREFERLQASSATIVDLAIDQHLMFSLDRAGAMLLAAALRGPTAERAFVSVQATPNGAPAGAARLLDAMIGAGNLKDKTAQKLATELAVAAERGTAEDQAPVARLLAMTDVLGRASLRTLRERGVGAKLRRSNVEAHADLRRAAVRRLGAAKTKPADRLAAFAHALEVWRFTDRSAR
ncbi:MAG TPA: hypothetical protein VG407_03220 [Caulobacteraceae bacterium]|nr:hypothetical protein [Caulobacteraceae bacterium]